jgi:hypothetical protein
LEKNPIDQDQAGIEPFEVFAVVTTIESMPGTPETIVEMMPDKHSMTLAPKKTPDHEKANDIQISMKITSDLITASNHEMNS